MADQASAKQDRDLARQLDGLFSDLAEPETVMVSLAAGDENQQATTYQLENLFSEPLEAAPAVEKKRRAPRPLLKTDAPSERKTARPPKAAADIEESLSQADDSSIEERLRQLLKSSDVNRRRQAIQHLSQIQSKWVIDPLLQGAADSDREVATLALTALLQIDDVAKRRVVTLAQQPVAPLLHKGSEAYLSHLLGQSFVYIPYGSFLMGSDQAADGLANPNEQPQHAISLAGYWISRYPVTVARYQAFMTSTRYQPRGEGYREGSDDHPVADITWHDALAYCNWLGQRSGLRVTLPSEAEWEKAARGTDGRRYPWGNQQPTERLCNFHDSTAVGHYSPQGDSPFGCADMAGNVWEWTRSAYKPYPYNPRDGRENMTTEDVRVIRGLTFNNAERFTRCAFRYSLVPHLHLNHLGFRVVVASD